MEMTRVEMIDRLMADDYRMIIQERNTSYLRDILLTGFRGYDNYTDDELLEELDSIDND